MKIQKPKLNNDSWFTMLADTQSEHVDIYIYGIIGIDVSTNSFIQTMQSYSSAKTITVYLSTVGGFFDDGLVIFNTLKQHSAEKTVIVMGFALSWGSLLMLVASPGKLQAVNNALFMIHKPQGMAYGDANEMRKEALILDTHESAIIPEYQHRLKLSLADMQAIMAAETWYTAEEAKTAGLIDTIIDPIDVAGFENPNAMQLKTALSAYKHPPTELLQRLDTGKPKRFSKLLSLFSLQPNNQPHPEEIEMTKDELMAVLAASNAELSAELEKKMTAMLAAFKGGEKQPEKDPITLLQEQVASLKAENEKLKKPEKDELTLLKEQVASLLAENAELKKADNPTKIPANTGAADDHEEEGI